MKNLYNFLLVLSVIIGLSYIICFAALVDVAKDPDNCCKCIDCQCEDCKCKEGQPCECESCCPSCLGWDPSKPVQLEQFDLPPKPESTK